MSVSTGLAPPAEMHRGLKNRHLQLIAIGGAIGTGLFLGSGKLISLTGPAIIFVYMVIGFFVFFVMRALGELLLSNLHYKTFGDIAKDMLGPWAGFFVSWNYWFSWVIACVADIVAITAYAQWFNPDIPAWLPALITAVVLTLLNLQPVKFFGETEFWFAIIKIVAILGLIGVGIFLIATRFQNPVGDVASISNLWSHGGMFPMGASGFVLGFQMGIFSFIGVEMVGTAAAETENPRKTLPKAINSIVARILIFYVGALAIIMSVTRGTRSPPTRAPSSRPLPSRASVSPRLRSSSSCSPRRHQAQTAACTRAPACSSACPRMDTRREPFRGQTPVVCPARRCSSPASSCSRRSRCSSRVTASSPRSPSSRRCAPRSSCSPGARSS